MKARNGFVSNSSTASFVIAGVLLDAETNSRLDVLKRLFPEDIPEDEDDLCDWMHDNAHSEDTWVDTADGDNSLPEGMTFAGVLVDRSFSDGGHREVCYRLSEVETKVGEIRTKLGLSEEEYPTMLISGTECC
jgi:hypothetical protein